MFSGVSINNLDIIMDKGKDTRSYYTVVVSCRVCRKRFNSHVNELKYSRIKCSKCGEYGVILPTIVSEDTKNIEYINVDRSIYRIYQREYGEINKKYNNKIDIDMTKYMQLRYFLELSSCEIEEKFIKCEDIEVK